MMRPYQFINGPWENARLPTIVRDDPDGGDPHILATIKRVHNPDALHELCRLANDAAERRGNESLTAMPYCDDCLSPFPFDGDERCLCPSCRERKPRFAETFCSSCGRSFGPGNHGFSHCADHAGGAFEFQATQEGGAMHR